VVQGAPITTFDVDIVHRRSPGNVDQLLTFLAGVGARYRGRPEPPLPPSRAALLGSGHSRFMTDLGPLDVLGAIESEAAYDVSARKRVPSHRQARDAPGPSRRAPRPSFPWPPCRLGTHHCDWSIRGGMRPQPRAVNPGVAASRREAPTILRDRIR
jgi:hypothetical protein